LKEKKRCLFLGKAVPKGIKSKSLLLMKEFPEKFNADFEHNKKAVEEMNLPFSKTNRNLVIGFLTRKIKQQQLKEKAKAEAAKRATAAATKEKTEPKKE
jgi:ribosomal protein S17E